MNYQLRLFLISALRKELITVQVFLRFCKDDLEMATREGCGILGIDWSLLSADERAICLQAAQDALMEVA